MQCPVCSEIALAVSSREGVEIDYCPQCRGVWLDRGELDKIIDRIVGDVRPRVAQEGFGDGPTRSARYDQRMELPRQDRYDAADRRRDEERERDRRRRRRSFLEDLFDFD